MTRVSFSQCIKKLSHNHYDRQLEKYKWSKLPMKLHRILQVSLLSWLIRKRIFLKDKLTSSASTWPSTNKNNLPKTKHSRSSLLKLWLNKFKRNWNSNLRQRNAILALSQLRSLIQNVPRQAVLYSAEDRTGIDKENLNDSKVYLQLNGPVPQDKAYKILLYIRSISKKLPCSQMVISR